MDFFLWTMYLILHSDLANQKVRINHHTIMDQQQGRKLERPQVRTALLRLSEVKNQSVVLNSQFLMDEYTKYKPLYFIISSRGLKLLWQTAEKISKAIFNICISLSWTDKKKWNTFLLS